MEKKENYQPGLCNIGGDEISIRKKLFSFSFLVTILLTVLSFCCYSRPWILTLLFTSVFFTILLFIEIYYRFCIFFGFFNLYNFRRPGHFENVENRDHSRIDRKKALRIIALTLFFSALFTYLDYMVVEYIYH